MTMRLILIGPPGSGKSTQATDLSASHGIPWIATGELLRAAIRSAEKGETMQAYPHRYNVRAAAETEGSVIVGSEGLPSLATAPPPQYGGPGGQWSPETLLVAAAADCFILTFRAIAAASKLPWNDIECSAEGVLDRVDGVVRFTQLHLQARLTLPANGDVDRAKRLLEKAEKACLVTNSLTLKPALVTEITCS